MANLLPYPHFIINVDDQSSFDDTPIEEFTGLHCPVFFGRYAKGPANILTYCDNTNTVTRIFGSETFDKTTKYFTHESIFVETNFSMQGGFVVRLVPADSMTSSILILCSMTKDVAVPQYKRDEFGGIVVDTSGNPIPILDSSNQPVTELGVKLQWTARKLDPITEANVKNIKPVTTNVGGKDVTTFPVMAVIAKNAGAAGNAFGFRFYFDQDAQQSDRLEDNKALAFTFAPIQKSYTDNTPTPVWSRWSSAYSNFMLKPNQFDSKVMSNLSYTEVIENDYAVDTTAELPMDIYFFEENVATIGTAVMTAETNDTKLTDPYMVDIFTAKNLDGYSYHHVVMDSASSVFFNQNYTIYLQGGSDGSDDEESYQELIRQFLSMKTYPQLKDVHRYPISHLYDTGYAMKTKEALISFLGRRTDVRVELATQDVHNDVNTQAEDQSAGLYLRTRALMQVESTEKGTQCCRASVYAHCGKIYDTRYTGIMPTTLDILKKRCTYQSTGFIKGEPKTRPNSEVKLFKNFNWTAFDEDNKALFWSSGINYIQHCGMKSYFWPGLHTVHPVETSVLTEWTYVDAIVYTKRFVAETWTMFTDSTEPAKDLFPAVQKYINNKLDTAFGTRFPFRIDVYQTERDAKTGYILRYKIYLTGREGKRVWEGDIITLKEDTAFSTSSTTGA